jgi:acetylornithine deacetylase/succinyl-diaminopimelate desuccinylase-like protein
VEQTWVDELREFIAIPSVSADPAHEADVRRAAEWVRDFVKRAGGEAELVRFGERELVIGDIPANAKGGGDAATVMIYGHYDVQPPLPRSTSGRRRRSSSQSATAGTTHAGSPTTRVSSSRC